jgi:4-hydroxy-tetrahydrodipicolinate synthase
MKKGFNNIFGRLTTARVDSMGILGFTGSYAYLTPEQRKRVATLAKQVAGDIPIYGVWGQSGKVRISRSFLPKLTR